MANRDRHRQGVVYGPVRPQGRRDRGAIVGSLLGALVVLGVVALLGVGLITFLQGRFTPPLATPPVAVASPSPQPSSTETSVPSPSASIVPSVPPQTLPPVASPSVEPSPVVTPLPTPFVPTVNVGPGFITFGTAADPQLAITDPKTIFTADERMVWSAFLTQRADSSDMRILVFKLDPVAPDGQRLIGDSAVRPNADDAQLFLRRVRVESIIDGSGLYTVRYMRGTEVMSEGAFIVPEPA